MNGMSGLGVFNPYVGPRPFDRTEEDLSLFFGRDQECEQILSLIFSNPVVLVYAESGAGKTSLFSTQVAHTLEEYRCHVYQLARVGGMYPAKLDKANNYYVFNVLQSLSPADEDPQNLRGISLIDF